MSFLNSLTKAAVALAVTASAYATTAGLNFTASGTTGGGIVNGSGLNISRTWTVTGPEGPITIIATAWSLADGGTFSQSKLGHYAGWGLGVCNPYEGVGCSSPEHRVDNAGGIADFVLFQFSVPVNLISSSLNAIYNDSDATFFVGSLNQTLAGLSLSGLSGAGLGSAQNSDSSAGVPPYWRTLSYVGNNGVSSLLVGARIGSNADANADYFKIADLYAYTNPGPSVPEPSSIILIGTALLAVGCVRRRKQS